jgi:AraC-like DNA-binding protein
MNEKHMDIAKSFLKYSTLPIREIAVAIGYDDPLDFTKAFHRTYGMSPSKWRTENAIQVFEEKTEEK